MENCKVTLCIMLLTLVSQSPLHFTPSAVDLAFSRGLGTLLPGFGAGCASRCLVRQYLRRRSFCRCQDEFAVGGDDCYGTPKGETAKCLGQKLTV